MSVPPKNKFRKKLSGSMVAGLVVLLLIVGAVVGFFLFSPPGKTRVTPAKTMIPHIKPVLPNLSAAHHVVTEPYPVTPHIYKDHLPADIDTEKAGPVIVKSGRLAIIIDDMGSSLSEAHSLTAIKVPLTFAIIPGLHFDKNVAAYAASKKIETLIHIPMQPKGWPERHLEANGLLVSMDADELQERVSFFVQQFPESVGVNNHMGSEFTEQEEKITAVLQVLKKNNLFFVDSVTSAESVGAKVAQRLGLKSARRNVFLDNEQERDYILGQLNQAVRLAKKNGSAIAICHPHPVTIATLAAALPGLLANGVHLVPVSQLVK